MKSKPVEVKPLDTRMMMYHRLGPWKGGPYGGCHVTLYTVTRAERATYPNGDRVTVLEVK